MVDRQRPVKDLLRLIQKLSAHQGTGLTVMEIAKDMGISERTARRYIAAIQDVEPDLGFHVTDCDPRKRWFLRQARTRIPDITALELSALATISKFMAENGHDEHARALADIRDKLTSQLDYARQLRLDPDVELLESSVTVTHRPGPKASVDPDVQKCLLGAILNERVVEFDYVNTRGQYRGRKQVSPCVLVLGPRTYLVGWDMRALGIRNYAITGISSLYQTDERSAQLNINIQEYIGGSFGAFHDGKFNDWKLRFRSDARHTLQDYRFHRTQETREMEDGSIEISFHCESAREVAYECFRWSEYITSVSPEPLRQVVTSICADMLAACRSPQKRRQRSWRIERPLKRSSRGKRKSMR